MDDPVYSRSIAFGEGAAGGQQDNPSASLTELARRYNAQIPQAYMPSGTLNGMSLDQFKATLGGAFPVRNGLSASTYETKKFFEKQV